MALANYMAIKITHTKKIDGIEISFDDDKAGGGMKFLIKNEDMLKLEDNLEGLFKLAEDYLNQNYASMHERRQMSSYFNQNGNKI